MKSFLWLAVTVLALSLAPTAAAQEPAGKAYVQGTLGVTIQPEATANHRISPPLGGTGFPAVTAGGGYFVTPSLAIEGEFSTGEVSIDQRFSYFWRQDYTAAVRVTTIDGSLRWKPRGTSPVELVVGAGPAHVVHGTRDGIEYRDYPYPQGSQTPMPDTASGDWVWNVKGGADVVYPPTSRAAFVAGGRLRWRPLNSDDDYRGVSAWAVDVSAGLRVRF